VSGHVLAPFPGVRDVTLYQALQHVTRALAGIPPPPAAPPRTRDELIAYAAGHGIDLSIPLPGKPQTAPEATLTTPAHRKLTLFWNAYI
jgi:hypothetical protein